MTASLTFRDYAITSALVSALLLPAPWLFASSVRQVDVEEMLERSELLFEGRVIRQDVRGDGTGNRIYTFVTFAVLDVINGHDPGETVELRFLGGTLNEVTLSVSDMYIPDVGTKGIFFVERLEPTQVHPFYGWDQGHIVVLRDPRSGEETVRTRSGRVIYGLDWFGGTRRAVSGFNTGVASGVRVTRRGAVEAPLTAEAFKNRLRGLLVERSR